MGEKVAITSKPHLSLSLEDEEYDKLLEKQGNNNNNDEGVNVKRRHDYDEKPPTTTPPPSPSSDDKDDDGNDSDGNGAAGDEQGSNEMPGDNKNSGSGSKSSKSSQSAEEEKDSDGTAGGGCSEESDEEASEESDETSCSGKKSGKEDEDTEEKNASCSSGEDGEQDDEHDGSSSSDEDSENSSSNADIADPSNEASRANSDISDTGADENKNVTATKDSILKAMEEAARNIKTDDIKAAEAAEKYEKEFEKKLENFKNQSPKPMDMSGINAKYDDNIQFNEVERVYKPNIPLPVMLEKKGSSLRRKIEEVLKNKQQPDRRGMRSGTIDGTRLCKLIESETTIFKKRGEKNKPDVAGFLLLDNSGSMGNDIGSTRYYACNALSVIEEGFKPFMPLKIAAFDAYGSDFVSHEVVKEFDEVAACNFTHNFYKQGRSGYGNKDGYSIRVATQQLLERPEKEKILIIASDGLPTDYRWGESGTEDVKSAVAEARAKGIKVIGMYMYSYADDSTFQAYHNMYAPDYLMCTMDEIEGELTRVMKRLFK